MEKQKLIYVESKALFSPSEVSDKAIVFIKDTKEIWTHGVYFSCSGTWATPITLSLTGDTTGSVSIDGSGNVSIATTTNYLSIISQVSDANSAANTKPHAVSFYRINSGTSNLFPVSNNANGILSLNVHDYSYTHLLGFSSNGNIYHRRRNGGTWETSWKTILSSTNYTNFPHTFASLTNKPTTLSGYGITDCIPIIKGGLVTTDTDLSTLGMTAAGAKLSVFHLYTGPYPTWLNVPYMNVLMFRSTSDSYGAIGIEMMGRTVLFIGGRNAETTTNNVPNWWYRLLGASGLTYNLATIQTTINNLGSTYLPLTGGTLTDTLILKAGTFTASNSNSYSGGRYQAVSKPNIRLIGDSTYGLSTIEFTSLKGDTSINKPSDSGFILFQPYGVSALSSVGSHPTLKTSGETNALVLGVTNDSDDIIVLLSPSVSGLRHACGATEYYLPHVTTSTTTANKPLVSTTTAHVYTLGAECLPLSGGTMTGKITLWSSNADAANTGGLNANNSNIYGLNSLYFADPSETAAEGINFYRSSTTVDSLWGSNGNLYWTPNRTYGLAGTSYYVLTSNNYSTHLNNTYLPLSGGTMTGNIILTTGKWIADATTSTSILGTFASGNSTEGLYSEAGVLVGKTATQTTLSSNGDDLWHYRNSDKTRYKILDAANYTNYTIPYAKATSVTGVMPIINNGNLWYHNNIRFLYFTPDDNHGAASYLLIAELTNYGTKVNTSYVNYGLVGTIYGYRGGNMANTHAYNVSVGASIGPETYTKVYTSAITDTLVPMIVKYDGKYYIALLKSGSSTGHYFIGLAINLLSSYIIVNDSSLIEIIKKPQAEVSTSSRFYNSGNPKDYLHEGNYSNYALPLTGGTLTGILRSTQVAGNLGTSPIVCTGNVTSAAGINNTYSHLASNLAASGVLLIFIGKVSSAYNGCSIGYLHRGDGSNTNAITLGLHSANNLLIVQGNGNVGIGNVSPSYKLSVNGDIYSSGYVRGNSGFIKTDSSNSYVLLGGGGHKLLSDLSSAHTHDWSSITSKPSLLGAMANPIFYPYADDSKLGAYISTINNRFYSADLRYTVTTTNLRGDKHSLFDDNYDGRMEMDPGTTATITIEGYNFVYNNGYIMLYFYLDYAYPLKFPKSITAKATILSGTEYTLNRVTAIESGNTIAFLIGLEFLTKLEFTIVSQDDAYCGITNIDYFTRRTENTVRDCAVVTKYNANTLYHNLTAPKYIVKNGTSSQFLKADGSLDNNAYLPLSGGTMTGALNFKNNTWNKVGDDAYMGDCNVAGMIGIKGSNAATPGFAMYNNSGTLLGKLYASGTSLYWSGVKLLTSTGSAQEAYLAWGGTNLANNSSPIDAILEPSLGANRLAFLSPDAINIEYSQDGGTTWLNYNATDAQKVRLFCGGGNYSNFYLGGNDSTDPSIDRTPWRLRITISVIGYSLYCLFIKFLIYTTDVGNTTYCLLLGRKYSDYQNNIDAWVTFQTARIGGWSGWNTINHPNGIILPHTAKYAQLRFEFYMTSLGTTGRASIISKIEGFAHKCWSWPSNMAGYGNIYSYDWQLNVTFPAKVTATSFSGPLTGNVTGTATSANKANFLTSLDKRNNYPALIVTSGGNIGAAFIHKSILGGAEGTWYDAIVLRGYVDDSAGNENALLFSKNTSSVYHSLYAFGSTTTWGTLYKFLDSGNYKNYAPSLSGEGATGTWGINISGTASKVANALTLLLNGGTTSGTNKFIYDGSSAYTVNITPDAIGAAASSHTHDYLPLSGGTISSSSYGPLIIERSGSSTLMAAIKFKNASGDLGSIGIGSVNGDLLIYNAGISAYRTILDSGNSSISENTTNKTCTIKINGTSKTVSSSTHTHDGSYLKLTGGTLGSSSASVTELRTLSSTAALRIMSYSDSTNYILSGNSSFDGNTTLKITGYSATTGTNLYFKFSNIYCRENDYINIDSGNYSSYALPLSGGTMTGTINCKAIVPITDNGYSIGTSSKTLYEIHANFFKRRGSSNDYVLLGGGEHKLISDFVLNYTAVVPGGNVGNNDSWTLILNNNYSTGWYNPCTMFYIRSHNFGCGILCFYHYWNTELTSGYYDNSVWFFGAEHSAYSGTMGGTGRDINNFLKVYIDKDNDNLKIYYNRYNNLGILILELLFSLYLAGTLYPKGLIRASHFITNGAVTDLPITSSTFVNIPILTAKNHTEDIKTTRSVYASAFYENSDIRLKENVHSIDLADLLKNVDLVLFNFKNDLNKKYGVIAQQLEQVGLNNLVYEHNGNKAVDYISLLVLETLRLRNEIKELKEKLDKKELSS